MKIIHKVGKFELKKESEGNLLLSNSKKGFLNLGCANSKYQGLFFFDEEVYKILEEIKIDGEVKEITNEIFKVKRNKSATESYFLPKNFNSLVYELSSIKEAELIFDIRKAYEMNEFGRDYKISKNNNKIIVECNGMFVVIGNVKNFIKNEKWIKYTYSQDQKRNSKPYAWYVFSALKVKTKKLVITAYKNKEKAINENNLVLKTLNKIKKNEESSIKILNKTKKNTAYNLAVNSLNNLLIEEGILAGLPWFFQIWTRDEMISLKALTQIGEEQYAKKILMKRLTMINDNGRLPNRIPHANLDSADSIGWMFLRFNDVLKLMNKKEKNLLEIKIKQTIEILINKYNKNGFFVNDKKETWMDTDYGDDFRKGSRIEIQALMIAIYELAFKLTKQVIYQKLRNSLITNVRNKMFHNGYLKDGVDDSIIRPNIFIAYYVCPMLLSKKEWEKCFKISLEKLWLEWGGISTIDKKHPLFTLNYTGENNQSYHRGDAWYWLNNMAAICLNRVNKKKFKKYINKIYSASEKDILWQGAIGSSSEISSAFHQTSDGCLNQAWSNAMFIELFNELK